MLNVTDIHSLSEFKRKTSEFMARMRDTGHPIVLTVNGSAKLVVQDAEAYQQLLELVERAEVIEGIRKGLKAFKQGKGIPALEALKRVRRKHGIPRRNRP